MSLNEEIIEDRVSSLRAELDTTAKEIISLIQALYGTHISGPRFDLKNSPFKMVDLLKEEVVDLIHQLDDNKQFYTQHEKELTYCSELTKHLKLVSNVIEKFTSFEEAFQTLKLKTCCDLLHSIEQELGTLPANIANLPGVNKVFRNLSNEKKLKKSRFVSKLRRLLQESIHIEIGSMNVHKKLTGFLRCEDKVFDDILNLSEIWNAIVSMNITHEMIELVLQHVWCHILQFLWKEKKILSPTITITPEKSELIYASLSKHTHNNTSASSNHFETISTPSDASLLHKIQPLGVSKLPLPDLFDQIGHILSFLWAEIFSSIDEVNIEVGKVLFDEPFNFATMLTETISYQLPKTEGELIIFKRGLEEPCRSLETKLENYFKWNSLSSIPSSSSISPSMTPPNHLNHTFLSKYLLQLSYLFSQNKRKEILKQGRELVLLDYHNTMIAAGDALEDELSSAGDIGDPKAFLDQSGSFAIQSLKFDSCQISLASCRLIKYIYDMIKQSTNSSMEISNLIYHSTRDCLEIFMAIIPNKFETIITTSPRMGAVFYNDCQYLAHNVILLTYRYRQDLKSRGQSSAPIPLQASHSSSSSSNNNTTSSTANNNEFLLQDSIGYIDFIPRLRKLGDLIMTNHINQQKDLLLSMVDRIHISTDGNQIAKQNQISKNSIVNKFRTDRLVDLDDSHPMINESMVNDRFNDDNTALLLVQHLEKLSTQWLGVLQDQAYMKFMSILIEEIIKTLMKPVLSTDCITEAACTEINRVFRTIQRLRALLPTQEHSNTLEMSNVFKLVCPSWEKFIVLTDLLECNLNDIADGLSRKRYIHFTVVEMTLLIKALFEETPRRQSLLSSIASLIPSPSSTPTTA